MAALTDRLVEQLQTYHAQLHAAIAGVPTELRAAAPPSGGWSVAQIIQHVALIDSRIAMLIARGIAAAPSAGEEPEADSVLQNRKVQAVLDRSRKVESQEMFIPSAEWSHAEGLQKLDEAHARLLEVVRSGAGKALTEIKHPHYLLGDLNLWEWMAFAGTHEARHAAQINDIARELGCTPNP
jgi:uncharacterized damage-inducible protein DinB